MRKVKKLYLQQKKRALKKVIGTADHSPALWKEIGKKEMALYPSQMKLPFFE